MKIKIVFVNLNIIFFTRQCENKIKHIISVVVSYQLSYPIIRNRWIIGHGFTFYIGTYFISPTIDMDFRHGCDGDTIYLQISTINIYITYDFIFRLHL